MEGNNASKAFPTAGGTPSGIFKTSLWLLLRRTNNSVDRIPQINAINNPFEFRPVEPPKTKKELTATIAQVSASAL